MIPLFPSLAIFHSNFRSKFSNSSSVIISPPSFICQFSLMVVSRYKYPSFTFQAEPTLSPQYLCHPLVVLPSNKSFQPLPFSSPVSLLLPSAVCFVGLQEQIKIITATLIKYFCIMIIFSAIKYISPSPPHLPAKQPGVASYTFRPSCLSRR